MPDQAGHEFRQEKADLPGRVGQEGEVLLPNGPGSAEVPESGAALKRHQTGSDRSWWKKYRTAIVLAVISLVLFLVTAGLYPSTTQLPVPLSSTLALQATQPVASITYEVDQISSSVAEMKVTILLPVGAPIPAANTPVVGLVLSPPIGTSFTTCPAPACKSESKGISSWKVLLAFSPFTSPNGTSGIALADFFVRAYGFGGTYNDVNASVVAPAVIYHGSGTPTLLTQYDIPDAAKYDWSVFPLEFASPTFATWSEPVTNGQITARVADGTDFANQGKDNYHTFLAGVILGLAGGALLTALQETLDANKK
jgi:hypothetical protein